MERTGQKLRSAGALFALALSAMVSLAGCALIGPAPTPVPVLAGSIPPPIVSAPDEPPPETAISEPVEAVAEVLPPAPEPAATVAILYSGLAPTQVQIADGIRESLTGPRWTVHAIDIDRLDIAIPLDLNADLNLTVLAAVGPDALAVARQQTIGAPIVFCQVLDPGLTTDATRILRGIAPMPPPALQFAAWAELDPKLERIGLITSAEFAAALPAAAEAAAAIGARLDHRISTSDRETLYIFRRLAPEIDGLWLAPDSAVLSAAVIGDMLALAAELEIGVLVFNENLLERGGLLSVGAPEEHVASAVVGAIEQIRAGRGDSLPHEIPLEEGVVRVNANVAAALGLPAASATEWVVRARP